MALAAILFVAFTLVSVAGAYLIGAHFRNRRFGILFALGVLAFFIALYAGVLALLRSGGLI